MAGQAAELEVVNRTLRVRDAGADAMAAATAPSARWRPPNLWPRPKPWVRRRRPQAAAAVPVQRRLRAGEARAAAPVCRRLPRQAAVAPAPAPLQSAAVNPVQDEVLALVVEKTGYPREMLDLDLDLEADLGVDTVKQAEMFAAIRETYGIPRDPNLKLRDFPTLARVMQFVLDRRPDLAAKPRSRRGQCNRRSGADAAAVAAPPAAGRRRGPIQDKVLELVVEKTGYPREMLDLDLDLEADLGVDTVKQAEMFAAIRETYDIPRDPNLKLRDFPTLAHVISSCTTGGPTWQPVAPRSRPRLRLRQPRRATPEAAVAASRAGAGARWMRFAKRCSTMVVEKTGYPKDMLDLDLDLEADLGVDTVKQAEIFAAIRETYGIPRDPNLKLRDFPTLAHVIRFARERAAAAAPAPAPRPWKAGRPRPRSPAALFEAADRMPRRVPVPALRPPLELMQAYRRLARRRPARAGHGGPRRRRRTLARKTARPRRGSRPQRRGSRWPPVTASTGCRRSMTKANWSRCRWPRWREAWTFASRRSTGTMRRHLRRDRLPDTFLISATRLGGRHGYDDAGRVAPLGGAVTGFVKAYKRETAGGAGQSRGFRSGREPGGDRGPARSQEALRDPGAVEIGYADGIRWTVGLEERPWPRNPAWRSTKIPCSWSPARRAASFPPSRRIWRRLPAAHSTCWIWCPSPTPPIQT